MRRNIGLSLVCCFLLLLPTAYAFALTRDIAFPVAGQAHFRDDFGEPRGGGTRQHLGNDIIADKFTPLLAVTDGVVTELVSPEAPWGYALTITDSEGYQYEYLHINNDNPGTDDGMGGEAHAYAPGISQGAHVTKGELIAWVGDSGNAEDVGAHLHFEIHDPSNSAIDPYESLVAAAGTSSRITIDDSGAPHSTLKKIPISQGEAKHYMFIKTISKGMMGEEVRQLQIRLRALGYMAKGSATGYFGTQTQKYVRLLQKKYGIEQTGTLGPKTRKFLNDA